MACKKTVHVLAILIWALLPVIISPISYANNIHSHELPPDKARVIVTFEGDIQPSTVEKYGQVLKTLKIINGLVAVINRDEISILQGEEGIKNVAIDSKISVIPPIREPIPLPATAFETLDANEVIVGWNLQEPGIAASDTPPPPNEPNSIGAWNAYSVDGSGVIIAILDSGVNYNLEDLNAPKYLGGWDFVNDDNDPMDDDITQVLGHGTEVATIALAEGAYKIIGAAPGAQYYALKNLNQYLEGYVSDAIAAIQWVINHNSNPNNPRIDIISMSFGAYELGSSHDPFRQKCEDAYNAGIILIAGVGNDGYANPMYPARFEHVIAVGGHDVDQHIWDDEWGTSNGGGDIVAPSDYVPSMDRFGDETWHYTGTSYATPHVSGILGLALQYARENNLELNNGYLWELVKHSAIWLDGENPAYQGKGKARALESIDLIASNWPIDYDFQFSDYAFIDSNCPVYQIGEDVNQTITLTNITDTLGNTVEVIENLDVVATQVYYGEANEPNLPGDSIKIFPTVTLLEPNDANSITLSLLYTIPPETSPGLVKTKLEFEFNFVGNDRVIKVSYNEPNSFWYAAIPGDLDLNNSVQLTDFGTFAQHWQQTDCNDPDWCGRADIDQSGNVDYSDLYILTENWLQSSIVD